MSEEITPYAQERQQLTTADFISQAIGSGVNNAAAVDVLGKLCDLKRAEDADQAKKAFYRAFCELQADMPEIHATQAVPGKDGKIRYTFAPYEEIMGKVKPLLRRLGFAITSDTKREENRVTVTMTLMHRDGHSTSSSFTARIGSGPPGSSEAQGDGAAMTYAKRFALCAVLNIVIEKDDDGRNEGAGITSDQIDQLRALLYEKGRSEESLLHTMRISRIEDMPEAGWNLAMAQLRVIKPAQA